MSAGPFAVDKLIDRYWPEGRKWLNGKISSRRRGQCELIIFIFGMIFAAFLAWRNEHLKVEALVQRTPLDPNMIYQNGLPAGAVSNIVTNAGTKSISFGLVTASHELDMSKEFEFRDWKLLCSGQEDGSMSYGAWRQINYLNFFCQVEGKR